VAVFAEEGKFPHILPPKLMLLLNRIPSSSAGNLDDGAVIVVQGSVGAVAIFSQPVTKF